ncbi:Glycosyltransferase 2 [Gracilaria domingensis]|nr:Glycosyltransferase 2 [Gracilaria domingensis]
MSSKRCSEPDQHVPPSQPLLHTFKQPSAAFFARLRVSVNSTSVARIVLIVAVLVLVAAVLLPPLVFQEELLTHRDWLERYKKLTVQAISSRSQTVFSAFTSKNYTEQWSLPPHIQSTYKIRRDSPNVEQLTPSHWTRPYVFLHYARPYPKNRSQTELFIYATGVTMGAFDRGFVVDGCLVGSDVYPSETYKGDVFSCIVPRKLVKGEFISLVLPRNEYVDEQLQNTVQIQENINVTLHQGDLVPLSEDARIHLDSSNLNENDYQSLMYVNSHQKFEQLGDDRDPEATDSEPRYEICLATQIKPFTNYLNDWIAYYKRIGVDMVYIVDNGAEQDLSQLYKHHDDVQVLYWPWRRSQTQALSYMLIAARPRCEWILMADVDEYAMLGIGKHHQHADKQVLRRYLRRRLDSNYKQFMFWFLVMANSGYVETPDGAMPEVYIHKFGRQITNGKSVAYTDHWWKNSGIHRFGGLPALQSPVNRNSSNIYEPVEEDDQPIMVHYHHRSFEDHLTKEKYGSASTTDGKGDPVTAISIPQKAPNWVIKVDPKLKYTYFRDIYRAIMKKPFEFKQTLVKRSMGRRCVAQRRSSGKERNLIIEEEHCDAPSETSSSSFGSWLP